MSNRNRTAGILAELQIRRELEELGFDKLVTTRAESKNMDDRGVDLIQLPNCEYPLPCYVQSKRTLQTPKMELLETDLDKPLVIIHKKQQKKGKRFYTIGEYAIMKKEFLYELLKYVHIKLRIDKSSKDKS